MNKLFKNDPLMVSRFVIRFMYFMSSLVYLLGWECFQHKNQVSSFYYFFCRLHKIYHSRNLLYYVRSPFPHDLRPLKTTFPHYSVQTGSTVDSSLIDSLNRNTSSFSRKVHLPWDENKKWEIQLFYNGKYYHKGKISTSIPVLEVRLRSLEQIPN